MTTAKFALTILASTSAAVVLCISALIIVLSVTEYRPKPTENAIGVSSDSLKNANSQTDKQLETGQSLRIVSWNIGFGGLGAEQDFFMDGGTMVRPQNKADVEKNLKGIVDFVKNIDADIWFIQEIDTASKRSFYIDQSAVFSQATSLPGCYAYNYKCLFVPFPLPPLGRVSSGLATFTKLHFSESVRYALPVSFTWPTRIANLKRCLLVNRFPLLSGGELVTVNVHLEAYDEGEGKIAQTKALMDILTAEYDKGNFVIAGGDFNQTFPNLDLSAYPKHEGLWQAPPMDSTAPGAGWCFAADDKTPSCRLNNGIYARALNDELLRKNWQYYIIDGFIVSPNVELKSVRTMDESFMYADHNPVEIEVCLKAGM